MLRQHRYELLALALSYPNQELLSAIEQGLYDEAFKKTAPIPSDLDELEVEYCRLFVGPGHVEVPPYESVYRSHEISMQKGTVLGPAAVEVSQSYLEAGLQLASDFGDMPDHIAVETWFLAYLEAMAAANPEGDFLQYKQQFIEKHLGQWVITFAQEVRKASRHPWYSFTGDLLMEMFQTEPYTDLKV